MDGRAEAPGGGVGTTGLSAAMNDDNMAAAPRRSMGRVMGIEIGSGRREAFRGHWASSLYHVQLQNLVHRSPEKMLMTINASRL
jgi:hypothetical protein